MKRHKKYTNSFFIQKHAFFTQIDRNSLVYQKGTFSGKYRPLVHTNKIVTLH